jgi:hypothetical protein
MLYCEKCGEWVEYYPMLGRKQHCLICNSKLRKEFKIKIDISKLEKQMRIRDALAEKPDIQPSIQCDKCHKWIEYNYCSGYSHRCSGRADEIRRAAHKRLYSTKSLKNRDAQIFEMYNLANDLDSASVVYDPTANKPSRKDVEMNNRKREQVKQLVMAINYAKERILYLERLKRKDDYDILIKDNTNNTEPEVIENGYEIINQIIYSYKQSLENYNKELDELLTPETTGNEQYVPPKDKRWFWGKGA